MSTTIPEKDSIDRQWVEIDAAGQTLGRVATRAASILRGKDKVIFTPHMDTGDFVIVLNASGVRLTGNKSSQKFWNRHSGYPGGLRSTAYGDLLKDRPEKLVELAIRRMLPKNRLGRRLFTKLHVYAGAEHPHSGQRPRRVTLE